MKIHDATVLITGANRGIGLAFAREVLVRGARKVYAGVRDPSKLTLAGVEVVRLDVTNAEDVAAAASRCTDVTLLIINAGIAAFPGLSVRRQHRVGARASETNFGPLRLSPGVCTGAGGPRRRRDPERAVGGELDQCAAAGDVWREQAAAWALTNGLRHELRSPGHPGAGACTWASSIPILTRGIDLPKSSLELIVRRTLDAGSRRRRGVGRRACTPNQAGLSGGPGVYLLDPGAAAPVAASAEARMSAVTTPVG